MIRVLTITIFLLQVGCRGAAESSIRAMAFREAAHLEHGRATINDADVDDYLDELGLMVLHAARDLGDVPADEWVPGDAMTPYDRFDVVLVHTCAMNAWVYGDDFACVTTNLVLQAERPEEIVAVLCHEFAHIEECHLVKMREREYANHAVGDLIEIAGTVGELALLASGVPLAVSKVTRKMAADHRASFQVHRPDDEFEADLEGLRLYASMGLDPERYDDFYQRVLGVDGDPSQDSHPMMAERLRRIDAACEALEPCSAPTVTLDRERLADAQRRLREVLLARAADRRLVSFEDDLRTRSARSRATARSTACCPFSPDREALQKIFVEAMRRDRPASEPAGR